MWLDDDLKRGGAIGVAIKVGRRNWSNRVSLDNTVLLSREVTTKEIILINIVIICIINIVYGIRYVLIPFLLYY